MNKRNINIDTLPIIPLALFFVVLPILFYATGDFPRRTLLKESISLLTLIAFFLMLAEFFLARSNNKMLKGKAMSSVIKIHKIIGYVLVGVLLVHPLLIVVPRYFESGIGSLDAFITIITTLNSLGIVLGIIAWCLMLILGGTALMRKQLPLSYKTWRMLHGVLAVAFITLASWHAIDLGRHTSLLFSSYVVIAAASGVFLLLKTYFLQPPTNQGSSK